MIPKIRPVSWTVRRTSASCSSVVMAGLSTRKSLPWRITRTPSGARRSGMAAEHTSWMDGSFRISSSLRGHLHAAIALLKSSESLGIRGVHRDQFTAAAPDRIRDAVDVVVVQPDDRELDRVFGRVAPAWGRRPPRVSTWPAVWKASAVSGNPRSCPPIPRLSEGNAGLRCPSPCR